MVSRTILPVSGQIRVMAWQPSCSASAKACSSNVACLFVHKTSLLIAFLGSLIRIAVANQRGELRESLRGWACR